MVQDLKIYIEQNNAAPCGCNDLIFRNWNEFLELLFMCGGSVNEILWFEYVLIDKQAESLGGGGYIDRDNPECMWAETMIYDRSLGRMSLEEIKDHIENTVNAHSPRILVPCFFNINT